MKKTLAIDFAWRNTGWVIVDENGKPEQWGVIKTKPRKKKNKSDKDPLADAKHETKNHDHILMSILNIINPYIDISCLPENLVNINIIAEITYFSQKASDGILIGMGWALLHRLHAEFLTGSQVKYLLLNNKKASKAEISKYINENGGLKLMMEKDHIKDAYATYLAWKELNKFRLLK